jgi:hypothetical protein
MHTIVLMFVGAVVFLIAGIVQGALVGVLLGIGCLVIGGGLLALRHVLRRRGLWRGETPGAGADLGL